ncbi:TAP-like protein-domain-containing protein [Crucibulum laeve]|uniref:TAP-like protein-domain-containing protein n=1 Tax=Crucibulum laeve TaxID=68775 RepID=A0A5C3LPI7_9AGAR|nr:TAP-like protein-domain-containing protein [Crucibulum laeve]
MRQLVLMGVATIICYTLISFNSRNFIGHLSRPKDAGTAGLRLTVPQREYPWEEDIPSTTFQWKPCYTRKQCSRLIVPLNYSDPYGEKATIAVIKKPALFPVDSKEYKGPVLLNPGGPGGSGVNFLVGSGDMIGTILGPQFDIISFDPRGVGRSTPRASFFKSDAERALWGEDISFGLVNNSVEGVSRTWARAQIVGKLAEESDTGHLRHINTDQTARDMLTIVEAFGQKKIQYWGFSYGTVLGATFAAMFPDKVHRLIIDGVADSEDYYSNLWSKNLLDTDKALQTFFTGCVAAGPESCAFHAPKASDIAKNLTTILDSLRKQPIPVRTESAYGLLDYARLKGTILRGLYSPYRSFQPLAKGLSDLVAGDPKTLFKLAEPMLPLFECSCDSPKNLREINDAAKAIMCNDGDDVPGDLESAQKFFDTFIKESQWAEVWADGRIGCSGWPKFPKNHFQGPFIANTSHPILLIGNTADPVTPLWAAQKMSRGFTNSVVLTQDSPGHCSLAAPSLCTQQHVRDYFLNGVLPKPGTICSVSTTPFPRKTLDGEEQFPLGQAMTEEERSMFHAIHALSKTYPITAPF